MAKSSFTESCLIAADIDKTILTQSRGSERKDFVAGIANSLMTSAMYGVNIAVITGNSMDALCSRFLEWLTEHLCHTQNMQLIDKFHFFCNSGGVYANIKSDQLKMDYSIRPDVNLVLREMVSCDQTTKKQYIKPAFIELSYIKKNMIYPLDIERIKDIVREKLDNYKLELEKSWEDIKEKYDVFIDDGKLKEKEFDQRCLSEPTIELRNVNYMEGKEIFEATIQITIKPILSFRHAKEAHKRSVIGKDMRKSLVDDINTALHSASLEQYIAKPGGISSIDITLERLDKAYALEYLIDFLRISGSERKERRKGSNCLYFGDEVIVGGGNDYPVTRIPGLQVFAVNPDTDLIPFLNSVCAPDESGPQATKNIIDEFNIVIRKGLHDLKNQPQTETAVEMFRREFFKERITKKISKALESGKLSADDVNLLHTIVTLMARDNDDHCGKKWLHVLISELDSIMLNIQTSNAHALSAIGSSHSDWRNP